MLRAVDWTHDREWERAIFMRTDARNAQVILARSYPMFKAAAAKVAGATDADYARAIEGHKERMRKRREQEAARA